MQHKVTHSLKQTKALHEIDEDPQHAGAGRCLWRRKVHAQMSGHDVWVLVPERLPGKMKKPEGRLWVWGASWVKHSSFWLMKFGWPWGDDRLGTLKEIPYLPRSHDKRPFVRDGGILARDLLQRGSFRPTTSSVILEKVPP